LARKLVIGNWKLNGSLDANSSLLQGLRSAINSAERESFAVDMVVCPPSIYLPQTQDLLKGSPIHWGAQDLSNEEKGAFTGEVAASMLLEFGCSYVLVGHSERRSRFLESSELVASKAMTALKSGLTPVICVGETLAERERGSTFDVLSEQLRPIVALLSPNTLHSVVIAYEPLWAIGTGKNADGNTAQEVHAFIRNKLAQVDLACAAEVSILYGGSVKGANASEYAAQSDVDGVLVGGASLIVSEFLSISQAFHA
jgi:triosephosphate isomerase (TIM)